MIIYRAQWHAVTDIQGAHGMKFFLREVLTVVMGTAMPIPGSKEPELADRLIEYVLRRKVRQDFFSLSPAMEECKLELIRQFPGLAAVMNDEINPANVHDWLRRQIIRFGEQLEIEQIDQ